MHRINCFDTNLYYFCVHMVHVERHSRKFPYPFSRKFPYPHGREQGLNIIINSASRNQGRGSIPYISFQRENGFFFSAASPITGNNDGRSRYGPSLHSGVFHLQLKYNVSLPGWLRAKNAHHFWRHSKPLRCQ